MKIIDWILSLVAALILLQTLYFKFTAHPESIYIFETVGLEPVGRIGSGITELIAGICLIIPRFRIYGAILGVGVMLGAIFFHLTSLGIEVKGDGGQLFYMAVLVCLCCFFVILINRKQIPIVGKHIS
jgi:uncharacterized membrane protein YphA (DoxX/SURF4 family)